MQRFIKKWGLLISGVAGVLLIDQGVKTLLLQRLALGESWAPIPAIGEYFRITYSLNTGAAFGIFPYASDIFLVLAFVTAIAFVIAYPRLPEKAWLSRLSIALITGGALSNAADRLRFGHVVDYVQVQIPGVGANISNFADHAITVGVILLLIDQWLIERANVQDSSSEPTTGDTTSEMGSEADLPPDTMAGERFHSEMWREDRRGAEESPAQSDLPG